MTTPAQNFDHAAKKAAGLALRFAQGSERCGWITPSHDQEQFSRVASKTLQALDMLANVEAGRVSWTLSAVAEILEYLGADLPEDDATLAGIVGELAALEGWANARGL